jgi:sorbitol-specific phosphotransferase system component IIC
MICSYLGTFVVGSVGVLKVELRGGEIFLGMVVLAIKGIIVALRFLWFLFDGLGETRICVHLPQLALKVILKLKLLVI